MNELYAAAGDWERRLGDPCDDGRIFSYARCGDLDDHEEFPYEICRELDVLGLPAHYVPARFGGVLRDYDDAMQVLRVIARRDLTVAIAHGSTFLGAVSVWVGGSVEQGVALAARIRSGAVVSWGLTERDHGGDLVAGEVAAEPAEAGFRVDGEKWLIGNATRSELMCLLARSESTGGARGFSVLLVDKRKLAPARHHPLPAVRLHGIRGADISGIAFTQASVGADALVGSRGDGIELVLRGLQLTRILCAALSLGAADQALGMAVTYALDQAGGRPLIELPHIRRTLTTAYTDLLLVEALALVAARSVQAATAELAVVSAATKFYTSTTVERLIRRLSTIMGWRASAVGAGYAHGRFQKIERDHRIVGIFDGSTVVNLHALITVFPALARAQRRGTVDVDALRTCTTLSAPLPELDPDRLTLWPRTGCGLVQSLPAAIDDLTRQPGVPPSLVRTAGAVRTLFDDVLDGVTKYRPTPVDVPTEAFELAERYAGCVAAAAAVQLWLANRDTVADPAGLWESGLWLEACLSRVLERGSPGGRAKADVLDRLARPLVAQHEAGLPHSLLPAAAAGMRP